MRRGEDLDEVVDRHGGADEQRTTCEQFAPKSVEKQWKTVEKQWKTVGKQSEIAPEAVGWTAESS